MVPHQSSQLGFHSLLQNFVIKPWQLIVFVTCVVYVIKMGIGEIEAVPVRVVDFDVVDVAADM